MNFISLQLLERLLKSGRPEDLETANRLIKSTMKAVRRADGPALCTHASTGCNSSSSFVCLCVFQEQEQAERVSKRESTLREVESSTKQLREMLEQQTITGTSVQPSDDLKVLTIKMLMMMSTWNCFSLCGGRGTKSKVNHL